MELRVTEIGLATEVVGDRRVPKKYTLTAAHDDGSPGVRLDFEVIDGVPQCRVVTVSSPEGAREVRSSDMRGVKVEDLLEMATAFVAMKFEHQGGTHWRGHRIRDPVGRQGTVTVVRAARRQAKRKLTPAVLAEVARLYRESIDDRPTARVAEHFEVAHRTAALYVKTARAGGFLGAAIVGKAGEQ